jgi:hypothetical protein
MRFARGVPLSAWSALLAPVAAMPFIIISYPPVGPTSLLFVQLGLGVGLAVASSHVAAVGLQRSGPRIFFAILALLAILPVGLNILSEVIASANGCYVNEHGTYTRGAGASYDKLGCRIGALEAGSLLHAMHVAILGFIATWVYWIALLYVVARAILRAVWTHVVAKGSKAGRPG